MAHEKAERARRMATLAVQLVDVAPAHLGPLETAHLATALARALEATPCDLSLRHTRAWARGRRIDADAACAFALERGAVCDCELSERLRA